MREILKLHTSKQNEKHPYTVTDDSDGYESDRVALQLMTAEAEIYDNFDTTRLNEEPDYLN